MLAHARGPRPKNAKENAPFFSLVASSVKAGLVTLLRGAKKGTRAMRMPLVRCVSEEIGHAIGSDQFLRE